MWRPALVRADLLGKVIQEGPKAYRATWTDEAGADSSAVFRTEPQAVNEVARNAAEGLRFHDSYATWLVYDGVPINDAQRLLGLARASTTLDLYTHHQRELNSQVYHLFADDPLTTGGIMSQAGMPTAAIMLVDLRFAWSG